MVQLTLNGLINGSILLLIALGLTLVFRISRFANVAHAQLVTFGAYTAFWASSTIRTGQAAALVFGAAATVAMGLLAYRLVYAPLSRRAPVTLVIASIGVGIFLQNLIIFIWGTDQHSYPIPAQRGLKFAGLTATRVELAILAAAVVLILLVHLLLQYSRLGKEMRAVADSADLARVVGIRPGRVVSWMWVIASVLAALAGAMVAMKTVVDPYLGWNLLLSAFAAAVLGGIGNPYGAMVGAAIMGMAEELSTLVLPTSYKVAVALIAMIVTLLIRPSGLFGEGVRT